MLNSHRQITTPTSAISPATIAVATPPDHNIRASTCGRIRGGGAYADRCGGYADQSAGYGRLSGLLGSIGTVMVLRPSERLAAPSAAKRARLTPGSRSKHGCTRARSSGHRQ